MNPSIFTRPVDINAINLLQRNTVTTLLGIEFTEAGPDYLIARMPVDVRTVQPMGILHGGSSVVMAETMGSVAANLVIDDKHVGVGLDINANHLRAAHSGWVTGHCSPVHIGRTTQVWSIDIRDEARKRVCISRITIAVVPRSAIQR